MGVAFLPIVLGDVTGVVDVAFLPIAVGDVTGATEIAVSIGAFA